MCILKTFSLNIASKLDELHILNIKAENAFDLKIVDLLLRRFAEIVSSNLRKVKINKSKFNNSRMSVF